MQSSMLLTVSGTVCTAIVIISEMDLESMNEKSTKYEIEYDNAPERKFSSSSHKITRQLFFRCNDESVHPIFSIISFPDIRSDIIMCHIVVAC